MSIAVLIIFLVACLIFLFLGLLAGYYIYSPKDASFPTPSPAGLLRDATTERKVYAVKPLTVEEQDKKGTKREAEEKEMESLLDRIIPVPKTK